MLAELNGLKHLTPKEFDAKLDKALEAVRAARLAEFPPAKPKKAAPKKAAPKKKAAKK